MGIPSRRGPRAPNAGRAERRAPRASAAVPRLLGEDAIELVPRRARERG